MLNNLFMILLLWLNLPLPALLLPVVKTGGARSVAEPVSGPLQPGGLAASPGDVGRLDGMKAWTGGWWVAPSMLNIC
jgi:hypothetical protein